MDYVTPSAAISYAAYAVVDNEDDLIAIKNEIATSSGPDEDAVRLWLAGYGEPGDLVGAVPVLAVEVPTGAVLLPVVRWREDSEIEIERKSGDWNLWTPGRVAIPDGGRGRQVLTFVALAPSRAVAAREVVEMVTEWAKGES